MVGPELSEVALHARVVAELGVDVGALEIEAVVLDVPSLEIEAVLVDRRGRSP